MISLGHFLHNSTKLGVTPSIAYNELTNEFNKGNMSYPRSDGKNHHPIKMYNPSKTHKLIKKIIDFKDKYLEIGKTFLKNASVYLIVEKLGLSTSSSLVDDIEIAKKSTIEENKDIYFMLKQEKNRELELKKINDIEFEKTLSEVHNNKIVRKFDDRNR